MAKNPQIDLSKVFTDIKEKISLESSVDSIPYIPDILEFCNSKKYLNLPSRNIELYPMQQIILKVFYRGQSGNEHIKLTDEELEILRSEQMHSVMDKYNSNDLFRELVLVLGRRSGKDFMVSLMALYESMKLLEIPGGCPYKYYKLAPGNPIYILTVATSADQARILFVEIKEKLQTSQYFKDKIGGIDAERVWLLTPEDRKRNKIAIDNGTPGSVTKGSVVIMSGHSNSDSLLGKGYFALLFDEVASFKTTGSSTSGERLYAALGPGTVAFNKELYEEKGKKTVSPKNKKKAKLLLDNKGLPLRRLDSKIISISSPRAEQGIFYQLYKTAHEEGSRLAFRLPTWKVNLGITEELLRSENKYMSANAFQMEFGAEFSGTAGEKFILDKLVDDASQIGEELGLASQQMQGRRGMVYYAHLDPAATSHNYALVVLHVEERIQIKENDQGKRVKEKVKMFIVDHLKVWYPKPNEAINVFTVDKYIIDLSKRFRFNMVSYDSWDSRASILKLRSKGIPTKMTPFRKQYKMAIYNQLEDLLVNHQLALPFRGPHSEEIKMELKCLKRIYTPVGFKIQPDPEAAITTDDICVHPETIVFTAGGPIEIKNIQIGEKILTHLGRYKKVIKKSIHKPTTDIYKLRTYYGLPLYATGNHPVEIFKDNKRHWKRLDEITIKDRIIRSFNNKRSLFSSIDLSSFNNSPSNKHHNVNVDKTIDNIEYIRNPNPNAKWHKKNIILNYDFGYLCGIYAAEGSIADHGIALAAHIYHTHIHERINESCKKTTGIKPTKPIQGEGKSCQINVNSQLCKKMFLHLFGCKKAPEKTIPACIMTANKKCQIGFIKGYFDGDGSINQKHTVLTFTSTSIKMTLQTQQLLLMFGIVSSVSISKRKGQTSQIHGRVINHNADLYNIRVIDTRSFNVLSELMDLGITKKQSKFHKPKYEFMDGVIITEIRSITRSADLEEVVNISVEEDNSFVAGSINTHNCDALAGACGVATETTYGGYAKGGTVYMPQSPQTGSQQWNMGRGSYNSNLWRIINRKFGKF